jgi:ABC-type sulfate transport system permease subunit
MKATVCSCIMTLILFIDMKLTFSQHFSNSIDIIATMLRKCQFVFAINLTTFLNVYRFYRQNNVAKMSI